MIAGLHHCGGLLGEADNTLLALLPASVEVFNAEHLAILSERFHHNLPQLGALNVTEAIFRSLIIATEPHHDAKPQNSLQLIGLETVAFVELNLVPRPQLLVEAPETVHVDYFFSLLILLYPLDSHCKVESAGIGAVIIELQIHFPIADVLCLLL